MQNKLILLALFSSCFLILQSQVKETLHFWTPSSDQQFRSSNYQREIIPEAYVTFELDYKAFEKQLSEVLPKNYAGRRDQTTTVYLPNPKGEMEEYTVWRDNLLPKKLNEKYPEIAVYAGYSKDDPHKTVRFDFTSKGFRAMSRGLDQSTYYIDPIAKGVKNTIIAYYKKDYIDKPAFECLVDDAIEVEKHTHDHMPQRMPGDCDLHTFELALACTGEYATFHGGTKASVMAEYTTSINRINLLYENEIGVRFVFIPNTDELIFLNGNTDPYTNNNGSAMLNENQNTIDDIIGSENYDIGHVYSTGGGGIAQLNSPCNNGKARGVTGLPNPVGDPFYIDYVAHEMGHQFGATHTYNNSCGGNRTNSTAFEPGSGSTIMSYAGICAPNVQFSADAYFHSASLIQMGIFLGNTSCEDISPNGSDRPVIAPLQDYNIPIGTPFELTANATINDGSALSYCWEQIDSEIANMPPEANSLDGPMFRTWSPTANPSRPFPATNFIVNNLNNEWEVLPLASREFNFKVTVRASGGGSAGCVEDANLVVNSTATSGPFLVLSPNSNIDWTIGETESVMWDVANTTAPPVNCQNVNILLSIDGGSTYPISLLENTPNDGQVDITVPNFPGFETRIRVQGANNVFFDISNENFSIVEPVIPTFTLLAEPNAQSICGTNTGPVSYALSATSLAGFNNQVEYTVSGLPSGATASFVNNNSIPNANITLNLAGLENVSTGNYTFTVQGNGGGQSNEVDLTINIVDSAPLASNLLTPVNAEADVDPFTTLSWTEVDLADGYILEVSTDANFNNLIHTVTTEDSNATPEGLTTSTVYYWRVKSTNICGEGAASQVYRFRTSAEACNTYTNDNSTVISTSAGTINSTINVPNGASIQSIVMSAVILHSWIGDIDGTLTSPNGNSISIFDRPGFPASNFGCENDNIRATFDDNANNNATDFENACGTSLYSIDGVYQPVDLLNNFTAENSTGDWDLEITDHVNEDGGSLNSWSLEICTSSGSNAAPVQVSNNVLNVNRANSANITNSELSFTGMNNTDDIYYTLITLPNQGTLMKNGALLEIGEKFTQTEINNNVVIYNHAGTPAASDAFTFDVEEINGGWIPNNTFQIAIIDLDFSATATLTSSIPCFGGDQGSISITTNGGNPPFMYSLDGANFQVENTFDDLSAGEYTVTVLDNDLNMVTSNTIIMGEPDQLMVEATVNENSVSLSVIGGTGSLEYSLDNSSYQASNTFNNLANGNYIFYVRDANGCIANSDMVNIILNDLNLTASITREINCHDGMDAQITVSVSGGTGPFTYSLNNQNSSSSNIFTNLSPGTYTIEVTDANQFSATSNTVTISNPTEVLISAIVDRNNISLSTIGGTGIYQYSLNNQNNFQNNPYYEDLANGNYTVYVIDQNGCIDETMLTINYEEVTLNTNIISPVLCNGEMNGIVELITNSGIGPFQYAVNNGAFQSSNVFENLGAGNYTFRVLDSFSDATTIDLTLEEPSILSLSVDTDQGTANLQGIGGTPPFSYTVDNIAFQTSGIFDNLAEGQHEGLVVDANECIATFIFTISINDLVATATQLSNILCAGDQTASISIAVSQGTEPYAYSLDGINFQNENVFENLSANPYTVTIRDADGFTTTTNIVISEPEALSINAAIVQNKVTLNTMGGTAPFEFRIAGENYQANNLFENLDTGNYDFEVRDANGCIANTSVNITYQSLSVSATVMRELDCAGDENARILASASGGSTPYMFSINGGAFQSSANFSNLAAGTYRVTVRDADNIEVETSIVEIVEPTAINLSVITDELDATITATGGTGSLNYSLDGQDYQTSNTFSGLAEGNYTAYVQDENGCTVTSDFSINMSSFLVLASVSRIISCFDESDGGIVVETSGGTNPKEYSLDGQTFQSSNFFDGLAAGMYTVTVRDANGTIVVTNVVNLVNPDAISTNLVLNQNNLTINASGGTGIYTYSLDGINYQNSNQFTPLENGNYTAYILDSNECLYTENFSVDFISLSADFVISGENQCTGDMNASITVSALGGEAPYLYTLSGGTSQSSNIFTGLGAGSYNIIVEDALGVSFIINDIEITDPAPLNLVSQIDGNQVTFTAQGGTTPYQYSLDNIVYQNENIFANLSNSDYTGYVQDANDCISQTNFTINVVQPLSIDLVATEFLDCTGETAGSITAIAMGGTPPYLFSLDNGPFGTENVFDNLPPGQRRVTVQDDLGNEVSGLALLTAPNPLDLDIIIIENDIEIMVTGGSAPYNYSIDGGQAFSNSQFFTDLDIGEYIVFVEDANGCVIETTVVITSVSTSSIDHRLILDLAPNPTSDITYLSVNNLAHQEINISLIDILGRTIKTYENSSILGSNKIALDVSEIVSGTYLIRLDVDGQVAVRKLIIE